SSSEAGYPQLEASSGSEHYYGTWLQFKRGWYNRAPYGDSAVFRDLAGPVRVVRRMRDDGMRATRTFLASFLVLFLEIALIRWMPAYIRLLSYFSNFILLASFLGIGLGCLLA